MLKQIPRGFLGSVDVILRYARIMQPTLWKHLGESETRIWERLKTSVDAWTFLEQLLKQEFERVGDQELLDRKDSFWAASARVRKWLHDGELWAWEVPATWYLGGEPLPEPPFVDNDVWSDDKRAIKPILSGIFSTSTDGTRAGDKLLLHNEQHVKELFQKVFWQMYREPACVEAPIPLAAVLKTLRDESGDERALRFSKGIANELTERGGLDDADLFLYFEGDIIPVDRDFYPARLKAYGATDERSPIYKKMEEFVRETFVNNMVVPLDRLVALREHGVHLSIPQALTRKFEALQDAKSVRTRSAGLKESRDTGHADQEVQAETGTGNAVTDEPRPLKIINVDEAVRFLSTLDLTITHLVKGRQQRLTQNNVGPFLKEQGFDIGINKAQRALGRVTGTSPGRPRKCHDVMTNNDGS